MIIVFVANRKAGTNGADTYTEQIPPGWCNHKLFKIINVLFLVRGINKTSANKSNKIYICCPLCVRFGNGNSNLV